MPHLFDLSLEILTQIAGFSLFTLKALRLTHSYLCQASTPHLFRSITLVPHLTSLENLLAVSRSHLAHHVHTLVYDMRVLASIRDIRMAFEANEFTLVGTDINVSRKNIFTRLDEHEKKAFSCTNDMMEAEMRLLLEILPNLRNLERITLTAWDVYDLPHFYAELKKAIVIKSDYYFEISRLCGHHARSMLLCLGALDLRVRTINFVGIEWTEIVFIAMNNSNPNQYLATLQRVFQNMHTEDEQLARFSFLNANLETRGVDLLQNTLTVCAEVLNNVRDLTLFMATSGHERLFFRPTGPSYPFYHSSARLEYPIDYCLRRIGKVGPVSLRRLTLSSLLLEPEHIVFLLSGCGDTLEHFSIGDARLCTQAAGHVDESCWVETFELIKQHAQHLKSVRLFGRLYNGGSQDWILSGNTTGSLKSEVERWMVHGTVCPLDSERMVGGIQGTRTGDASFKILRRTLGDVWDRDMHATWIPMSDFAPP